MKQDRSRAGAHSRSSCIGAARFCTMAEGGVHGLEWQCRKRGRDGHRGVPLPERTARWTGPARPLASELFSEKWKVESQF